MEKNCNQENPDKLDLYLIKARQVLAQALPNRGREKRLELAALLTRQLEYQHNKT